MSDSQKEIRYVGVKENLAYGFANAGQVFGYNLVAGGYLSLFFTKVFGIPAAAVATMILVLGVWDTINDPIMGGIIDRTRTKKGKLRPYLLFVPIPLAIATIMLFAGPEILSSVKNTTIKIVYMYISYFIWEFFYTIGDVPFWGMSTAISPSPSDRTRAISTARFISSILGGLSTTFLVVMMDLSNNGVWGLSLSHDFLILAFVAAFMLVFVFSLAGRKTKERVVQSVKEPSVLEGFKVMFKNKPLMLIIVGNVIGALTGLAGVFQTYYYDTVLNLNSAVLWISLPGTIFGFLTYLLIPKLKKRFDNRQIVMMNIICRLIVGTAVFLVGLKFYNTSVLGVSILLMVQNFIFSFFNTINMVIPTEMIGDTVDYMEWKTGERTEGVSFSVLTFVGKMTGSISLSLGTALLPIIGLSFSKNAMGQSVPIKASDRTDLYIWGLFTLVPHILGAFSIIPYLFYDLTGDKLAKIRKEVKEKREQLSEKTKDGDVTFSKRLEEDAAKAQKEVDAVNKFLDILKSSTIKTPLHIIRLILFFTPLASMCLPMFWAGHKNISLISMVMMIINHGLDLGALMNDKSVLFGLLAIILVIVLSLAEIIASLFSSLKNGFKRNLALSSVNYFVLLAMTLMVVAFGGKAKLGLVLTMIIYVLKLLLHCLTSSEKFEKRKLIATLVILALLPCSIFAHGQSKGVKDYEIVPATDDIRVVSFNVASAFGTSFEDTDSMTRCDRFADYVKSVNADLIGTQELNSFWLEKLEKTLDGYGCYGVVRGGDSEQKNSEMNGIFWNSEKFEVAETNTFWLSQTPDYESKLVYTDENNEQQEAGCNRICSYAVLKNKKDGSKLAFMNTHLDNASEEARTFGAKVILEAIDGFDEDTKIILTGDFNEYAGDEAIKLIEQKLNNTTDFDNTCPTYQEWGYKNANSEPIDFIFTSGEGKNYQVLNNLDKGYVSDHYGIMTDIVL